MRLLLFILTITAICLSCKKDKVQPGGKVEIYLLKSYQAVTGKCQIDASTAVLQDTATVKNQDILEYFKANYQFALTDNPIQKLRALNDGTAFAVAVDKQVIYYGIYKPSYFCTICSILLFIHCFLNNTSFV